MRLANLMQTNGMGRNAVCVTLLFWDSSKCAYIGRPFVLTLCMLIFMTVT